MWEAAPSCHSMRCVGEGGSRAAESFRCIHEPGDLPEASTISRSPRGMGDLETHLRVQDAFLFCVEREFPMDASDRPPELVAIRRMRWGLVVALCLWPRPAFAM